MSPILPIQIQVEPIDIKQPLAYYLSQQLIKHLVIDSDNLIASARTGCASENGKLF